jgi:hypothetical protein
MTAGSILAKFKKEYYTEHQINFPFCWYLLPVILLIFDILWVLSHPTLRPTIGLNFFFGLSVVCEPATRSIVSCFNATYLLPRIDWWSNASSRGQSTLKIPPFLLTFLYKGCHYYGKCGQIWISPPIFSSFWNTYFLACPDFQIFRPGPT